MRYCLGLLFLAVVSQAAQRSLPLVFEENRGQSATEVRFLAHGSPGIFFTRKEAVLAFPSGDVLRLQPENAAASAPEALEPLPGKSNYLNREPVITGVRQYGRIRYGSVYPGIDLVYYGRGRELEYDFAVAAGARPERIRMMLHGAKELRIDAEGNLVAHLRNASFLQKRPEAWQAGEDGVRYPIDVHYVLAGKDEVAFALGDYDRSRPLVIDPLIDYSTYLGSEGGSIVTGGDVAYGIAADSAGNAYITGDAPSGQFPVTTGIGASTGNTGYVAKLSPDGAHLIYSTYLNLPAGQAIAVDSQGSAYVTGWGPNLTYVVKLAPDGSAFSYTYTLVPAGGLGATASSHLALDSAQNVYINGTTTDTKLSTTSGSYQSSFPGQIGLFGATSAYGFAIKLNAAGRVAYSTYLRAPLSFDNNTAQFLAVDGNQDAIILTLVFPSSGGQPQSTLVKLNPTGTAASNTVFPNATTPITFQSIGTDPAGNLYAIGGGSLSANTAGPVVVELNASGSVVKGRYLAATSGGVYADSSGNAYVVGNQPGSDLPFITRVNSSFSADMTILLSNASSSSAGVADVIRAAALDPAGNLYLTLFNPLVAGSPQFPATPGAYQTSGGTFAVVKYDASGLAGNGAPAIAFPSGVTNAASGQFGPIAPGEILAVYGTNLGPAQLVSATFDANGKLPTNLAGTTLLIGGQAVPLLYTSAAQIAGIAPASLTGDQTDNIPVQVEYQGIGSPLAPAFVATFAPGLFTSDASGHGQAAIVNQDGSINSLAHPAPPGTVVSLFCSGCGDTSPPGIDGAIATSTASLAQPIIVTIGGQVAPVMYAGAAPGLVNGAVQINVKVPVGIAGDALPIGVFSGGPAPPSPPVTMVVH